MACLLFWTLMVNQVARDTPLIGAQIVLPNQAWQSKEVSGKRQNTQVEQLNQNAQLYRFYKIKGIAPSFWSLPAFSGLVSQFCV